MRIGINLLFLKPAVVGGTETYAKQLIAHLRDICCDDSIVLFVNKETKNQGLFDGLEQVVCNISGTNVFKRYIYEQTIFPSIVAAEKCDLLHSLGYVGPLLIPCRHVVTIHDTNFAVPFNKMPFAKRQLLKWFVIKTARRADAVITISNYSASQIKKWIGISGDKIFITYNAAGKFDEAMPYQGVPESYILTGAASVPHKNIETVIYAFRKVRDRQDLHLLIFGGITPYQLRLKGLVRELGLEDRVVFTGYVKEAELNYLYQNALAFVFPSLYEGFGIPVIEAMQCGVPVISSAEAALKEIVNDAGLLLKDPRDIEELTGKIEQVLIDKELRIDLKERGKVRAAEFSWNNTAKKTYGIYRQLMERNS